MALVPVMPDYEKIAKANGANYLTPSGAWTWQSQGQFIKDVIERGDDVLIGTHLRIGVNVAAGAS